MSSCSPDEGMMRGGASVLEGKRADVLCAENSVYWHGLRSERLVI